nr:MAG: structural polyprotein [Chemarfal virus 274]
MTSSQKNPLRMFFRVLVRNQVGTVPTDESAAPLSVHCAPQRPEQLLQDHNEAMKLRVLIQCETVTIVATALYTTELYQLLRQRFADSFAGNRLLKCEVPRFTLTFQGKPLSERMILLRAYGMKSNDVLCVKFHLMLGGSPPEEKLERELQREVGNKKARAALRAEIRASQMEMQSRTQDVKEQLLSLLGHSNTDYLVGLLESVVIFGYQLVHSNSHQERLVALMAYAKGRSNEPLLGSRNLRLLTEKISELMEATQVLTSSATMEVQGFEGHLHSLRGLLENYEAVRDGAMMQKLHKFLMYALSLSLFEKAGITFDTLRYSTIEREALKRKFTSGPDFVHCVLDTTLFLVERGYQCMKTGDMSRIFHSGGSYEAWFDAATQVMKQSKFLSNPEPQAFNVSSWLADLEDCIDKGKAIGRHTRTMDNLGKRTYLHLQQSLEMCKADYLSKRAAGADRRAPFGILVFGPSGIAKSAFTKALYYHFGKLTGNNIGDEFRYVRNANDDFWSGFRSYQWCVQLDDIAYMHPNKAPQGDASVLEMLQVVNSVPFVPNQAELEDKGRTPMRAELVVATSNEKTLNAYHYFQCPLAVQRRLPFVVTLKVKPEYARDGGFLDASRVPELADGEYADFWQITVDKVMAAEENKATFVEEATFDSIYAFMSWFSTEVVKFRSQQDKVDRSDKAMKEKKLCTECYMPEGRGTCDECNFALGMQNSTFVDSFGTFDYVYQYDWSTPLGTWWFWLVQGLTTTNQGFFHLAWLQLSSALMISGLYAGSEILARSLARIHLRSWSQAVDRFCLNLVMSAGHTVLRRAGNAVETKIGKVKLFALVAGALTTLALVLKFTVSMWASAPESEVQGNTHSKSLSEKTGRAPKSKEEKESVWFRDEFVCTAYDMPKLGTSWNALKQEQVSEIIGRNTLALHSRCVGSTLVKVNKALALGGQLYVTNNHGLPEGEDLVINAISAPCVEGVVGNLTFRLTQSEIFRRPQSDLAFFKIRVAPPRKNLSALCVRSDMGGVSDGFYVQRDDDGEISTKTVRNVRKSQTMVGTFGAMTTWLGSVKEPTVVGDCGSVLVLKKTTGYFIAGLHVAGLGQDAASIPLTTEVVEEAVAHFEELLIQSGTPLLSAPSAPRELKELSPKSPFRFLPTGVASVYGSFSGFRGGGRSRVVDSPLRASAEARGYVTKTAAPAMSGWQPWYNAAKEMVNPVTELRGDVLDRVKSEFLQEILQRLDKQQLQEELFVYDNLTAINGANGVRFVDKMNRATSMGAPWKKSKKEFLTEVAPTESCSDPRVFVPEVMERVDQYIAKYLQGERCVPVFSGSLKDEPLKLSKVEGKNTRVFCASPADWNLVVRKYYLAFIRVMQLNRFTFEASIGCVAQSREWEDIRTFLVQFGTSRLIAGDYKAFDKRMPASIILAAFDIIQAVCKESGNFTQDDLKVMQGIAYDTAFPNVDLNGDLVEFFGSNPSGHPLTVVINSLANSLYVRYGYAVLNPKGESAADFKKNVALQTYGDDNVMGVHRDCGWFNHTSLAKALGDVGITYTMADKEAESIPFITIDDVSFLKRVWKYDTDLEAYVCPLDESSIAKMMTKCVPSRTVTADKQAIDVLSTVCREYFWYGRSTFEAKRLMCIEMAAENDLEFLIQPSTFPTWEELKESFDSASHTRLRFPW